MGEASEGAGGDTCVPASLAQGTKRGFPLPFGTCMLYRVSGKRLGKFLHLPLRNSNLVFHFTQILQSGSFLEGEGYLTQGGKSFSRSYKEKPTGSKSR